MNTLTNAQETTCKRLLARWMKTANLVEIAVDEIENDGAGGREQDKVGQFTAQEIRDEYDDVDHLFDAFVEQYGSNGGKYQLRLVVHDENGKTIPGNQKRKTFNFKPERPGARSGSQGASAGIEAVTASLSKNFDSLAKENRRQAGELRGVLIDSLDRIETLKEQRHTDTMKLAGANTGLEIKLAQTEMELKFLKMQQEQGGGWIEVALELAPTLQPIIEAAGNWMKVQVNSMHLDNMERARQLQLAPAMPEVDDDDDQVVEVSSTDDRPPEG